MIDPWTAQVGFSKVGDIARGIHLRCIWIDRDIKFYGLALFLPQIAHSFLSSDGLIKGSSSCLIAYSPHRMLCECQFGFNQRPKSSTYHASATRPSNSRITFSLCGPVASPLFISICKSRMCFFFAALEASNTFLPKQSLWNAC